MGNGTVKPKNGVIWGKRGVCNFFSRFGGEKGEEKWGKRAKKKGGLFLF